MPYRHHDSNYSVVAQPISTVISVMHGLQKDVFSLNNRQPVDYVLCHRHTTTAGLAISFTETWLEKTVQKFQLVFCKSFEVNQRKKCYSTQC